VNSETVFRYLQRQQVNGPSIGQCEKFTNPET